MIQVIAKAELFCTACDGHQVSFALLYRILGHVPLSPSCLWCLVFGGGSGSSMQRKKEIVRVVGPVVISM